MRKFVGNERGSFVIDVFLLPIIGIFQVFLMVRYFFKHYDKRSVKIKLTVLVVAIFWPLALGLYYDLYIFSFLSDMSGNDFMWNWPILQIFGERIVPPGFIPTYENTGGSCHTFAFIFFFFVYPIVYWMGIHIGYILFGRSEKQKGGIDLVFPRKKGDKDNFN